jgi:hypothetical protein
MTTLPDGRLQYHAAAARWGRGQVLADGSLTHADAVMRGSLAITSSPSGSHPPLYCTGLDGAHVDEPAPRT